MNQILLLFLTLLKIFGIIILIRYKRLGGAQMKNTNLDKILYETDFTPTQKVYLIAREIQDKIDPRLWYAVLELKNKHALECLAGRISAEKKGYV